MGRRQKAEGSKPTVQQSNDDQQQWQWQSKPMSFLVADCVLPTAPAYCLLPPLLRNLRNLWMSF